MEEHNYQPIACHLYDFLEEAATTGKMVKISWVSKDDEVRSIVSIVNDIYSSNQVEYLKVDGEIIIKLDEILEFDGHEFSEPRACGNPD